MKNLKNQKRSFGLKSNYYYMSNSALNFLTIFSFIMGFLFGSILVYIILGYK